MSTISLSNAQVEIADKITWGQKEQIQNAMLSGVKMEAQSQRVDFNAEALSAAKYKAIEVCVVKITQDGQEVPYSREWLDNLSIEDGDKLYEAVEGVTAPAKK